MLTYPSTILCGSAVNLDTNHFTDHLITSAGSVHGIQMFCKYQLKVLVSWPKFLVPYRVDQDDQGPGHLGHETNRMDANLSAKLCLDLIFARSCILCTQ